MDSVKITAVKQFQEKVQNFCKQVDIISETDFHENSSKCLQIVINSSKTKLMMQASSEDMIENEEESLNGIIEKVQDQLELLNKQLWLQQKTKNIENERKIQSKIKAIQLDFQQSLSSTPSLLSVTSSKHPKVLSAIHEHVQSFSSAFSFSRNSSSQREKYLRQLEESLSSIHMKEMTMQNSLGAAKSSSNNKIESKPDNISTQQLPKLCQSFESFQIDPGHLILGNLSSSLSSSTLNEKEERLKKQQQEKEKEEEEKEKEEEEKEKLRQQENFRTTAGEWLVKIVEFYRQFMNKGFAQSAYFNPDLLKSLHLKGCKFSLDKIPSTFRRQLEQSTSADSLQSFQKKLDEESFLEFEAKNKMNTPTSFAIGIDLGTTFSCVGVYINGKVEIIPNDGEKTTPSYVNVKVKSDNSGFDFLVGANAKSQAFKAPETTIYEVKRLIGRKFNDPAIQPDLEKWPFKVVEERGEPKILIGEKTTLHPIEISSQILRKMKETAESYLNAKVEYAVITVPAYFAEAQRQATKQAGEAAGLKILRIINEPTAAAIAYNLNWTEGGGNQGKGRTGLVFDLGGGTLDVALFSAAKGDIKILKVGGDTHLGGVDFDNELVTYCIQEFERTSEINLLAGGDGTNLTERTAVNRKLMRLKAYCEKNKVNLSSAPETTVSMDCIHGSEDLLVKIDRTTFERLIEPYLEKAMECVKSTLKEGQLSSMDVDDIVLVGGSTRIPKVREMLQNLFRGKTLNTSINPDEAVAFGAAFEAAVLNGERAQKEGDIDLTLVDQRGRRATLVPMPRGISVQDVTPMSLGIEVAGGEMSILIPKQSPVPTQVSNVYQTIYNNQTSVPIVIYEGEEKMVDDNTFVGEFHLNGIPAGLAGSHSVKVTMMVCRNGLVDVTATCEQNGVEKKLQVRANRKKRTGLVLSTKVHR